MKRSTRFHVRPALDIEDAKKIARLLIEMERESKSVGKGVMSQVVVDPGAAFAEILHVVEEGAAFIVEDLLNGLVVGSLGLWKRDGFFFAPDSSFMAEFWFYVVRNLRNGPPTELLLEEAKALSDEINVPVYLNIFDPQRATRRKGVVTIGDRIGYIPLGRVVRLHPAERPVEMAGV